MIKSENDILEIIKTSPSRTALKDADVVRYCEQILSTIPEYESLTNICYSIRKDMPIKICPVCGKYIPYRKTKLGKDKFCSDICYRSPVGLKIAKERRNNTNIERYGSLEEAHKAHHKMWEESIKNKYDKIIHWTPEWQAKREATMLERYGAKTTLESDILKEKVKKTNLERYGVEHICFSDEIRKKVTETNLKKYGGISPLANREVQEKVKKTNLERYGVEYIGHSLEVREKIKNTNNKLYGCDFPLENKDICSKAKDILFLQMENDVRDRVYASGYDIVGQYKGAEFRNEIRCLRCNNKFLHLIQSNKPIHCPFCDKVSGSRKEKEIFDYIKSFGLQVRERDRDILDGKELDLVIPSRALAIEVDGIYWHSEAGGKDKNYHLNKTKMCNDFGIRLIHIFDDEIINKKQIVKARLRAILGFTPYKIQARKCKIKEISSELYNKFVEKYHIQGAINTSIRIGLFYKGRLAAVMGFNKSRFNNSYDYELMRYCTLSSFNVIGGASKLLNHFRKNYKGSIISYADKRWSEGGVYKALGFKELEDTEPNYFYVKGNTRESRQKYQKHKLKDILEKFDENLSEKQNMINNGYSRIWDCGNKVFVLENDEKRN